MKRTGLYMLLCCLAFSCDTDEAEFPVLTTSGAQQIGRTSVVLEVEVREVGSIRPIRYGFLWGTAPGMDIFNAANRLDLGNISERGKHSIKLELLSPGTRYFVRSFAANQEYSKIYYGNEMSFTTLD